MMSGWKLEYHRNIIKEKIRIVWDTITLWILSSRFHCKALSKKGLRIILYTYPDFLLSTKEGRGCPLLTFSFSCTRKTCKNTIVICCLAPETSAFEDASKMAQKWFTWLSLKLYQKGGNRSSSNSMHMKNFSVVSPRLQAINAEQVYVQNTPNYSDASHLFMFPGTL